MEKKTLQTNKQTNLVLSLQALSSLFEHTKYYVLERSTLINYVCLQK